jgi:hypothetical protein
LGLKKNITELDLSKWFKDTLDITVPVDQIRIKSAAKLPEASSSATNPITPAAAPLIPDSYTCTIFFDNKEQGRNVMIYVAKPKNAETVEKIFNTRHKVTLYFNKDELKEIKNLQKNM